MKVAIRIVASLAVAVGLIALLLVWTDTTPAAILDTIGTLDAADYWTALGVQAAIYPLRALRFRALLGSRSPSTARLLPVTASHILAANVLPAKVGEATLVLYLKRVGDVPAAHGLAVLLVSRILDLATVMGSLAAVCLGLGGLGGFPELDWLVPLGAALVVPTAIFAWLAARGDRVVALAAGLSRLVRLDRTALGRKLLEFAEKVQTALADVDRRRLRLGALATLPIWLLVFLFYAILARGYGLEVGLPEAVFGAGLAILANLLPVNGFAGFGVQDMGWVAGFTALGVAAEPATASGLASHVVYIFNIGLFGLLGHLAMGAMTKGDRAAS